MKFSAIPLINVSGVNNFSYSTQIEYTSGDATDIYLQLTDLEKNLAQRAWNPAGLRYIPPALSTLQITIRNIDTSKEFTRYGSQPFSQDGSIWKFSLLPTDPVSGTLSIKLVLTEPSGLSTITRTTDFNAFLQGKVCPNS